MALSVVSMHPVVRAGICYALRWYVFKMNRYPYNEKEGTRLVHTVNIRRPEMGAVCGALAAHQIESLLLAQTRATFSQSAACLQAQ